MQEVYFFEAMKAGANIHAPCVNHSEYLTNLNGNDIHVGFIHIQQFESSTAKAIVQERQQNGQFNSLEDFVNRLPITATQLEILIRINAFRFTGLNKYELMWEKNRVFNPKQKFEHTGLLFAEPEANNFQLPTLSEHENDQSLNEIEMIGFPLTNPFHLLPNPEYFYDCLTAKELPQYIGRIIKIIGYYVCTKQVTTSQNQRMCFGCWLDPDLDFFDTTHFPFALQKAPFRGRGIYLITGKVDVEFGFVSLVVLEMELVKHK